ncbi:MAG: HEAT repeat domain-containing protein [Planctomycetota bacterium]|nr:HEAT repeat domain-containing protein [Planctomycetota bacterium]
MRTQETFLCLALLSAAPLAAQEQEHPRLQAASAAETVEKDWSRAMSLYLGIAEDAELPREVRGEAAARMTRLLRRLGRTEDAQKAAERAAALGVTVVFPVEDQDAERIRALQERARALLDVKPRGQREFPGDVVEQILWIGDPAVPVITSWIDENVEARHFTATWAVTFLWRIGSPQAIDYLAKQLRRDSELAVAAAMSAGWMKGPEALPAVEAGLLSEKPGVGLMLFRQLQNRIPAELMLDVGARAAPELRAELIRAFPNLADDAPSDLYRRYAALVRAGLESTDPIVGAAASNANLRVLAGSAAGIELVLDHLHSWTKSQPQAISNVLLPGLSFGAPADWSDRGPREAERLAQKLVSVARATGPSDTLARNVILQITASLQEGLPLRPTGLELYDAGYPLLSVFGERDDLTIDDLRELLRRAAAVGPFEDGPTVTPAGGEAAGLGASARIHWLSESQRRRFLEGVARTLVQAPSGTEALLPDLIQLADAWQDPESVAPLTAMTRAAEAATWLAERALEKPARAFEGPYFDALCELGKHGGTPELRSAMLRLLTVDEATVPPQDFRRTFLVHALLSFGDLRGVEQSDPNLWFSRISPPYGAAGAADMSVYEAMSLAGTGTVAGLALDPERVAELIPGLMQRAWSQGVHLWTPDRVRGEPTPAMARALAAGELATRPLPKATWLRAILYRGERVTSEDWNLVLSLLRSEDPSVRVGTLAALHAADAPLPEGVAEAVATLVEDPDSECAYGAAAVLADRGRTAEIGWFRKLAASPFEGVREIAIRAANRLTDEAEVEQAGARIIELLQDPATGVRVRAAGYAGQRLLADAVPSLIRLLQDPEPGVRNAAQESLERIRFAHEQNLLWSRMKDGVDTSARGALERLLRQAAPTSPTPVRLAAIRSLGALGMPEALPYLIDWLDEKEPEEIRAAAEAAMSAIHLNPRRS